MYHVEVQSHFFLHRAADSRLRTASFRELPVERMPCTDCMQLSARGRLLIGSLSGDWVGSFTTVISCYFLPVNVSDPDFRSTIAAISSIASRDMPLILARHSNIAHPVHPKEKNKPMRWHFQMKRKCAHLIVIAGRRISAYNALFWARFIPLLRLHYLKTEYM